MLGVRGSGCGSGRQGLFALSLEKVICIKYCINAEYRAVVVKIYDNAIAFAPGDFAYSAVEFRSVVQSLQYYSVAFPHLNKGSNRKVT
jgi:hypothetical protein